MFQTASLTKSTPTMPDMDRIDAFRPRALLTFGAGTVVASVAATVVIRAIAVAAVDIPPAFTPMRLASVISLTVLGVIAATIACFILNRVARRPVAAFRRIAPIALVVSFIPDVAIWAGHAYGHTARASTVIPLMIMHVAVGAICLVVLPLARPR